MTAEELRAQIKEVEALKEGKALAARLLELLGGFDALENEANGARADASHQIGSLPRRGRGKLHFDVVRNVQKRLPVGMPFEVVESDAIAAGFEFEAGVEQRGIGLERLQQFQDGLLRRQNPDEAAQQRLPRAVDEDG